MDIWQTDKLVLFIAFVVPGFISLKLYETIFAAPPKDTSKQLVDAVTYSCINYGIMSPFIYWVDTWKVSDNHPIWFGLFCIFTLLIAPLLWAFLLASIRRCQKFHDLLIHPIQKPWDYIFNKRDPYYVVVRLKNDRAIAGLFGSKSFASSNPAADQIYLESHYLITENGRPDRPIKETGGILIATSEIESIEFFEIENWEYTQ